MPFQQGYHGYTVPYGAQQYGQSHAQALPTGNIYQQQQYQQPYSGMPQASLEPSQYREEQRQDTRFYQQHNFAPQHASYPQTFQTPPQPSPHCLPAQNQPSHRSSPYVPQQTPQVQHHRPPQPTPAPYQDRPPPAPAQRPLVSQVRPLKLSSGHQSQQQRQSHPRSFVEPSPSQQPAQELQPNRFTQSSPQLQEQASVGPTLESRRRVQASPYYQQQPDPTLQPQQDPSPQILKQQIPRVQSHPPMQQLSNVQYPLDLVSQPQPPYRAPNPADHQQTPLNPVEHLPDPYRKEIRPIDTPMRPKRPEEQSLPKPTSIQRVATQVKIPVMSLSQLKPQHRASKAGQSVDEAAPRCNAPLQYSGHMLQKSRANVAHLPLEELSSSQVTATKIPADVDYQSVLLALADEYISAAHGLSTSIARHNNQDDLTQYHELMSIGLGCMEAVLNNWRQQDPRNEARLRLRLASLLYEETENEMEAEEVLSKGIALCERARLHDLKYSMHHLLARVLFKSNPKAAVKAIDRIIPDAEAFQHWHWVYAFRLLRVSLSLQLPSHTETAAVLKHLNAVTELADENRHVAMLVTAAALEAVVSLRSTATDAVELAQRALATARSHQLDPDMQRLPQVLALLDFLDLACSLLDFNAKRVATKMSTMQEDLDAATKKDGWNSNGTYLVPVDLDISDQLEGDTAGIWRKTADGRPALVLQWLSHTDLYSVGYLLSGFAIMNKSCIDPTAEHYLQQGLKLIDAPSSHGVIDHSLSAAATRHAWQQSMRLAMQFHVVFSLCGRAHWLAAYKKLSQIQDHLRETVNKASEGGKCMISYLLGMCKQALGSSDEALELFETKELALPEKPSKAPSVKTQLCILAVLNMIMIMRVSPDKKAVAENLLAAVEPHILSQPSKAMLSAYHFLRATSSRDKLGNANESSIIKTKQSLQSALQAAKQASNPQLLSIIMNVITSMYFTNIVGDQAEKSARVGRKLANNAQDKLWIVVANQMLADTLERCGDLEEAQGVRDEGTEIVEMLPPTLKRRLQEMEDGD